MTGSRSGVATQLQSEEVGAVLTHCYGHTLNQAAGHQVKQSKVYQDALNFPYEIRKLICYSLEHNAVFHLFKAEQAAGDKGSSVGIQAFCHTHWTV